MQAVPLARRVIPTPLRDQRESGSRETGVQMWQHAVSEVPADLVGLMLCELARSYLQEPLLASTNSLILGRWCPCHGHATVELSRLPSPGKVNGNASGSEMLLRLRFSSTSGRG